MPLILETPRLILRPFQPGDAQAFLGYRNDPEVARYQGWSVPYPEDQAVALCNDTADNEGRQPGEWIRLAMAPKAGGEIVGDVAARILSDARQAELGVTLSRAAQGQGYGFEALTVLIDYLFGPRNMHRLTANIDPANAASARLLRRLGFRHEGRWVDSLWFKGDYASEDWFAILQREWKK
jgi:RimJ/RimL family protein N-acetyltransferase